MGVRLEVSGVRAVCRLGVSEEERALPQPVELGVVLWLVEEPAVDDIDETVSYAVLDEVVPSVLERPHVLIERLAVDLADALAARLDWSRLKRLEVRAAKLAPPLALVGAVVSAVVSREGPRASA